MKNVIQLLLIVFLFVNLNCGNSTGTSNDKRDSTNEKMASQKDHSGTAVPGQKYGIKSGIVTYETSIGEDNGGMKLKQVLYFDDYGKKECRETYIAMSGTETMSSAVYIKDDYMYTYNPSLKSGTKVNLTGKSGEADMYDIEKMKKDYKYNEAGSEVICDKTCTVMEVTMPSGPVKLSTWNRIPLRTSMTQPPMDLKAVKVEENADIPESKFEVPAGVTFTEQ